MSLLASIRGPEDVKALAPEQLPLLAQEIRERLVDLTLEVAATKGIPCQLAVRRTGGTDARSFQAHELGVPVIVLGVPARYIHTHNAVIDVADLQACVDLSVALVRRLDAKTVKSLTQYL